MYPSLALLARIESVAAGSPIVYILTLGSWRIWNFFESTVRLLPSETGCNKISQQDFAALADADMASQMLVLTFVFRTIWEQLLECDDESTQYDCFVFFVWLHRDGLRVWFTQCLLFIDIVSTCDSHLKTLENKRKLSTELTHSLSSKCRRKNIMLRPAAVRRQSRNVSLLETLKQRTSCKVSNMQCAPAAYKLPKAKLG